MDFGDATDMEALIAQKDPFEWGQLLESVRGPDEWIESYSDIASWNVNGMLTCIEKQKQIGNLAKAHVVCI